MQKKDLSYTVKFLFLAYRLYNRCCSTIPMLQRNRPGLVSKHRYDDNSATKCVRCSGLKPEFGGLYFYYIICILTIMQINNKKTQIILLLSMFKTGLMIQPNSGASSGRSRLYNRVCTKLNLTELWKQFVGMSLLVSS